MRKLCIATLLLAGSALAVVAPTLAGDWTTNVAAKPKPAPTTPPAAKPPATPAAAPMLPQTLYLVRSTLLALNDANRTGNYTVLRDLSAPSVRERTSAADLATVFAALRRSNLDLAVAVLAEPQLDGPPMLDAAKRLHLKGEYATEPSRIVFELAFEAVNGHWLLSDISISTRPAQKTAAARP